jgi:hypothetical protein
MVHRTVQEVLNISTHNALGLHRESQNVKKLYHLVLRLQLMKELFEVHRKVSRTSMSWQIIKITTT